MKNAAKLSLVVACFAGYAAPALALNPQPLPPLESHFTAAAPKVQLDCSSATMMADGKSVDAADFTATDDENGGCDVDAKLSPEIKSVRFIVHAKDGVRKSFILRFTQHTESKQPMFLER